MAMTIIKDIGTYYFYKKILHLQTHTCANELRK